MADMLHQIRIKGPKEKVFESITTTEGLKSWWTGDSVAEPKEGSIAEFGFTNRKTLFRMKIAELVPNKRVVWHCLGDWDEWEGTKLTWELTDEDGATDVKFVHADWDSTDGMFAPCNSTWGALMFRLRDYVEGKEPGPLFKGFV